MTKEEIEKAAIDNWNEINPQFNNGLNPYAHMVGFHEGVQWALQSENERMKSKLADFEQIELQKRYAKQA